MYLACWNVYVTKVAFVVKAGNSVSVIIKYENVSSFICKLFSLFGENLREVLGYGETNTFCIKILDHNPRTLST